MQPWMRNENDNIALMNHSGEMTPSRYRSSSPSANEEGFESSKRSVPVYSLVPLVVSL